MDSNIVGLSPSDQGQKEAFLNELSQFLSDKGRDLNRAPNLAGRVIDLHDLYNRVTSAGGYHKVTSRGYWDEFLDIYGYPALSATLAYGLQKIYQVYLEDYERVHYFGDDEPQLYIRSYPGGYRRYRYEISDYQRVQANMNMLKPAVSNYDRVVLSLESCLPNEIDFAVNACTLLSGESRHVLRLPQCRRIIDALLLHAGVVSEGCDSYREVLGELQNKTNRNFRKFWMNSIAKKSVLPILLPSNDLSKTLVVSTNNEMGSEHSTNIEEMDVNENHNFMDTLQKRLQDITENDGDDDVMETDSEFSVKRSKWSELFHGHRSLGVEDYEGQRVLQIALVLLNLSFEEFNVTLLARHSSLIRFVFLCIHSEYSCLRQTGLDILSNISSHMQLLHLQYDLTAMAFDTINSTVLSHDKFERIRGFEVLGNICRARPNIDYVCVSVADDVYEAAVDNLVINDVEILLAAIEALYRLSKLGETTCTKIIFVKGCVDVLVCLTTVNVRTFGPEKLAEIRLARKIIPGQTDHQQQVQQLHSAYHLPQQPHHQNQALIQRQMQFQQQPKLGSAHQAQPTYATAAPSMVPQALVTAPAPVAAPQPSNPVKVEPKVEPTPAPVQPQATPPPQPTPPPSSQPSQISSPPPSSAPPTSVTTSSPPGVGPTYTHSETGTIPPVFHYMPAPPLDIVQDSSAESFTKLWIWATYESQSESYIPRVDVYCEYLASSNRYGRQGKTEILSATDFGKCLKQIFPEATSRLFNQGRGQPQYHIAGIRKRATPLPVPGYQLKDSSSVFSSELEYEKIPVTKPKEPPTKTPSSTTVASAPGGTSTNAVASTTTTTSVPIQQLQFQPVLIVSAVPGTNNLALVPGAQLTASMPQALASGTISQAAVAIQNVMVATQATGPQTAATNENTASGTQIIVPNSQAQDSQSAAVAKCETTSTTAAGDQTTSTTASETCQGSKEQNTETPTGAGTSSEENVVQPAASDNGSHSLHSEVSDMDSNCDKTDKLSPNRDTNLLDSKQKSQVNSTENGTADEETVIANHVPVSNGYAESSNSSNDSRGSIQQNEAADTEEKIISDKKSKTLKKRTKSKECEPMVNGYIETHNEDSLPVEKMKTNGTNGPVSEAMNGETETEAAVNSILEPDVEKMDITENEQPTVLVTETSSQPISNNPSVEDNGGSHKDTVQSGVAAAAVPDQTTVSDKNTDTANQEDSGSSVPGPTDSVATCAPMTPTTQTLQAPVTPTNPIPHSALNQRLKDTITRRKNSQLTPSTPATSLPPSVIQQYSYKSDLAQQIIPITPQQLQQQYQTQRQPVTATNNHPNQPLQTTQQVNIKRPLPQVVSTPVPAKVPRPAQPQFTPSTYPQHIHQHAVRHPTPGVVHRPLLNPQIQQQQHMTPRPNTPIANPQAKPKPPTIDLMAPNASLLVLYRNVGKIPFANHMDEKEDAISKSIRLTASLILTNIARHSDLGRSLLQKHEDHLANIAMSEMDCSPIVAKLLSELNV